MNLASILQCHAQGHPNKTAIEFGNERVGYAELWQRVQCYAAYLHSRGITTGDRVGLALKERPGHLVLHYALARLGAIILPLDHRWTPTERTKAATAFNAKLIIAEAGRRSITERETLALKDDWLKADPSQLPSIPDGDDLPLLISLSPGATGRPKGALVTHEQLYQRFISQWVTIGFNSQDRFLGLTPLFFGAGRSFGMSFLAAGATVILDPPPHEPHELIEAINQSRASVTFLVPTQLRELVPLYQRDLLLPGLKKLLISGATLYPGEAGEIQQKVNPGLSGYYASSEGGGISVLSTDEFDDYAHTAGRAAFRTEIQIVDERDAQVRSGETGRLRYRGPGVATRFIDSNGREEAANAGGWFYPGDLAVQLDSGHSVLRGRRKDIINRGGVNIYPAEIEAVLMQLAAVREVAVVVEPSTKFGETVTAFIVAGGTVSEEALDKHCRKQLASYKVPSRYLFADQLPKKSSGKMNKEALLKQPD